MSAALTRLVHHNQRAHGDEHNPDQDNDQGALHSDLAPSRSIFGLFSWFRNEPRVNISSLRRSKKPTYCRPPDHICGEPQYWLPSLVRPITKESSSLNSAEIAIGPIILQLLFVK